MIQSRKDIIAKGRYNVWDIKDFLFVILCMTFLALGFFLLTSEELLKYSYYLFGAGLIIFLYLNFRLLRRGNFQVTRFSIVWKSMGGSLQSIAFDKIGAIDFEYSDKGAVSWHIKDLQRNTVKKFKAISPLISAGAGVLYLRYKDVLPEVVFNYWEAQKKGKRTYDEVDYQLRIEGTTVVQMKGALVLYDKRLLFIPTTEAQSMSEPEIKVVEEVGFILPESRYQPDGNIKTHTLIEAIIESNLPHNIRDSYLEKIAEENGGKIFANMNREGKQWYTGQNGVEVVIARV